MGSWHLEAQVDGKQNFIQNEFLNNHTFCVIKILKVLFPKKIKNCDLSSFELLIILSTYLLFYFCVGFLTLKDFSIDEISVFGTIIVNLQSSLDVRRKLCSQKKKLLLKLQRHITHRTESTRSNAGVTGVRRARAYCQNCHNGSRYSLSSGRDRRSHITISF